MENRYIARQFAHMEAGGYQPLDLTPDIRLHTSLGIVHQAKCRGRKVIVKMLNHAWNKDRIREIVARPRHYKAFFRSLKALQSISQHENVLPLEGYYFNAATLQIGLVWPLVPSNLRWWAIDHRKQGGMDSKRYNLLLDAAQGVCHLHACNPPIIHGNIRASSIMINDRGSAMVADFGVPSLDDSLTSTENGLGHRFQRIRWLAPELIRNHNMPSTTSSDLFAFAQVVVEVFTGCDPFHGFETESLASYIVTGGRPECPEGHGHNLWTLIKQQYWSDSPQARGSINDIIDILVMLSPLET